MMNRKSDDPTPEDLRIIADLKEYCGLGAQLVARARSQSSNPEVLETARNLMMSLEFIMKDINNITTY